MFKNLTHLTFAYKWVLWLIPVVFVWAGLWWYFLSKKAYPSLKLSSTRAFAGYAVPVKAKIKQLLPLFRVAALTLLLVAIARPQTSYDEEKVTTEGIDIVLAIDVSGSMLSKDFDPNRIEAAKKEAMEAGYDEAILLNSAGNVADGSISNIFMIKGNQIITPLISDGALPGVIRTLLLEEFKTEFSFVEKTITPEELMLADEIFLTNALMGVKKVCQLNHRAFNFSEITNSIQSAFQERKNYV